MIHWVEWHQYFVLFNSKYHLILSNVAKTVYSFLFIHWLRNPNGFLICYQITIKYSFSVKADSSLRLLRFLLIGSYIFWFEQIQDKKKEKVIMRKMNIRREWFFFFFHVFYTANKWERTTRCRPLFFFFGVKERKKETEQRAVTYCWTSF